MTERLLYLFGKYPLNLASHLCSGLPIILGLIFIGDLPKGFKLVLLLFALYFVGDSYTLWLSVKHSSTFPIQNLQPLFETWIVGAVYYYFFERPTSRKRLLAGLLICSVIIIFSYRQNTISTVGLTTQRLFITTVVLSYFTKILTDARIHYILFHGMFWVSAGLLINSAGTFFFSLFSSYLYRDDVPNEEFDAFWMFNQVLYIIFCLMTCVGIWVCRYEPENLV